MPWTCHGRAIRVPYVCHTRATGVPHPKSSGQLALLSAPVPSLSMSGPGPILLPSPRFIHTTPFPERDGGEASFGNIIPPILADSWWFQDCGEINGLSFCLGHDTERRLPAPRHATPRRITGIDMRQHSAVCNDDLQPIHRPCACLFF